MGGVLLTKNEFIDKLEKAREYQLAIDNILREIYQGYNFEEVNFRFANGRNLDEVIQCYVYYGELPMSNNIEDFWLSYRDFIQKQESDT